MLPYYLLVGVPALVCWYAPRIKQLSNKKNLGIVVFFFLFMILLALRDISCGADLNNYTWIFHKAIHLKGSVWEVLKTETEPMYVLWERLVAHYTTDFQIYLALTGVLCLAPIAFFYKREAELPFLTIVLFLCIGIFNMYFSGLRQAIAMGFAVPAWYFTKEKKLIRFVFVVAVASLFHMTALVMLLIYPVYHIRITKNWLWFLIPAIVLVLIYNKEIMEYARQISEGLSLKYSLETTATGAYDMLILYILFAVFSFVLPDEKLMDHDMIGLRNILLLVVGIQCFAPIHSLIMRINYYFLPFIPVLIPKIITRRKQEMNQVAVLSVYILACFFTVFFFWKAYLGADELQIFPYIPFWEG